MKKIFSKILVPSMVALSLGFISCSDDNNEPVVGPASEGAYFPSGSTTAFYVEPGDTEIELYIERTDESAAQTVALSVTDESGLFTVPTSVSFAAGSKQATLPVTFDSNKFEPKDYSLTITVDPESAYLYGMTEYSLTIGLANNYRWIDFGEAQYNDAFFTNTYYKVEMQQHALDKNSFRIKSPYAQIAADEGEDTNSSYPPSEWISFQLLSIGETYNNAKITMSDLVGFSSFCSGIWMSTYNDVINIYFPGAFTSLAGESNWTFNKVKSYQDDGTPNVVQLAPYYYMTSVGGWNYTQNNDMITIIFPGGRLMDASAEVDIVSVEATETSDVATIKANVTIGPDATSARVAIVEGTDHATGDFLITHDRAEYVTIDKSGEVTLTMPASSVSGKYMVIASTYTGTKAVEYNYATFDYTTPGVQPWTKIGTGTYTYSQLWSGADPGLSLYQSNDDPTLYKITDWGYGVDFYFTMTDGYKIMVDDQFTGYTHSSYGDVYVDDMVDFTESEEDGVSLYVNGTYNFNVVYYCSAGEFGAGYETFVLDSESTANAAARKSRSSVSSKQLNTKATGKSSREMRRSFPFKSQLNIF